MIDLKSGKTCKYTSNSHTGFFQFPLRKIKHLIFIILFKHRAVTFNVC